MRKKQNSKFMYSLFLFALIGILFYGALVLYDVYSRENNLTVQIEPKENIGQGDKIKLVFSTPVDGQFNLDKININPPLKTEAFWVSNKELILRIKDNPKIDQKYTITIKGLKTFWLGFKKKMTIPFRAVETPKIVKIYPSDKQAEVPYDASIKINFDKPLSEKLFLEIDINPDIKAEAVLNDERTSVEIIPKDKLEKAKKYEINISIRWNKKYKQQNSTEKFLKKIYGSSFITKIPPRIVYSLDKNGNPRATDDLTWEIPAKISEGRYIDIDLTHQVLSIFENGLRKGSYKVSSGKRGMNTPIGTFHILSKRRRPWSAHYGLYMPWYMGFTTKGHGIHELPEWPSGYKEGANHLGIPVSHGCVRLGVGPAKIVYDFASKGTPVVVHY